jgi:hypothetical protein
MPDVSFTELPGQRVLVRRFRPEDVAEFVAMSRSRAPGSRAMHSSTGAWLVGKLRLVTGGTCFPEICC